MKLIGFVMMIATILLSVSCKKNKDKKLTLPPATQTGENTLGFLIDDQVWIANGGGFYPSFFSRVYNSQENSLGVNCFNTDDFSCRSSIYFTIGDFIGEDVYDSNNLNLNHSVFNGCAKYRKYSGCMIDTNGVNKIKITYFNLSERIVSGTFEFTLIENKTGKPVRITNGRFDIGDLIIH